MLQAMFLSILTLLPTSADSPDEVVLQGKVIELTAALEALNVPADSKPIATQVVLVQEDGSMIPLLSSVASRALFDDDRLRDRPAEIRAWQYSGVPYLQVLNFKVEDEAGKLRTPEYYCEVCSISVRHDQPCPCCQDKLELRMKPE